MTEGYSQKILDLSKLYKTNNLVSSTKNHKEKLKRELEALILQFKESEQNIKQLKCAM